MPLTIHKGVRRMLPGQGGEDDKTLLLLPLEYRQRMEAGNGCRRGLVGCVGTI